MGSRQVASEREQVSHIARRLGMGANPDLIAEAPDVGAAMQLALTLADEAPGPDVRMPPTWDAAYENGYATVQKVGLWWMQQMVESRSPIRERLTWFWHDHFAISEEKVDAGWVLWNHLSILRKHSTGNFADLLREIARDSGFLWYLDGHFNTKDNNNENFGRELLELHTLGIGNYTQDDVVAAARACTGWAINYPHPDTGIFESNDVAGWAPYFNSENHDEQVKNFLGQRGNWTLDDIVEICLDQPATAQRVVAKLYRELIGLEPAEDLIVSLASSFSGEWGWEIMPLVTTIVGQPAFVSPESQRAKVRSPLEKAVSLFQAFPDHASLTQWPDYWWTLADIGYYPFGPPNPAGYGRQRQLLGPNMLIRTFELLWPMQEPDPTWTVEDVLPRLGLFELSSASSDLLSSAPTAAELVALAFASPEFAAV